MMAAIARAFRHALRAVRRAPAVPLACAAAMALGAGTSTTVFALVYGVLLRPLPYPDSDRLVQLSAKTADRALNFSLPEFEDWERRTTTFSSLALFSTTPAALSWHSETTSITSAVVSGRFFEMLGVPAALGRTLSPQDDHAPAVIISDRLWRQYFGAAPAAVGQPLTLNGTLVSVVGVASPRFRFPSAEVDVWIPVGYARLTAPPQWNMRGFRGFSILGRLAGNVSLTSAGEDVHRVATALSREFPRFNRDTDTSLTPLRDSLTGPVRTVLLVLLAAVALLLLAICANVSNMLIAQGISQRRDIAVRLALGASRREIAIQAAGYAVCIAAAGGGMGMALAAAGVQVMRTMPPAGGIPFSEVRVDGVVFAFAAVTVAIGMSMASALPLLSAWRTPPAGVLRESRSGDNRRTRRVHVGLVVVQVATSVALLIGAALFGRSLAALLRVDSGVTGTDLYTARIDMAGPSFATASQQTQLLSRLLDRLSTVPGVASVALVSSLPPDGSQMRTAISPAVAASEGHDVQTEIVAASPLTFATLGVSVLHGRGFSDADGPNAPRVMVLSESVARRLFPGRDPIGQALPLAAASGGTGTPTVIGIVRDVRYTGLSSPQSGAVYLPFTQRPFRSTYLTVRTRTPESELAATLGRVLYEIDPSVALGRLRSWDQVLEDATAQPRLRLVALGLLSTLTLIVATIGLYGVMAHAVSLRQREFAVRAALGANRRRIVSMVVAQGFGIAAVGTVAGAAIAFATSRFLASLLFGLAPSDPQSFVTAAASMLVVGLLASAMPAWQATKGSVAAVLKSE